MESKTIMFVKAWMEPLRQLTLAERWNVVEAIMEYDSTGETPGGLSGMESLAFTFIRAEIDRMKTRYREVCDKRREAANSRWSRRNESSEDSSESLDGERVECNCISGDANGYNKEEDKEETETETENKKELRRRRSSKGSSKKKSASSTPSSPPYDDSMLLDMFFAPENMPRVAAIGSTHNLPVSEIRRMAEEIMTFWMLTDKTHSTYKDASSHLVYSISDQAERERRHTKNDD